MNTVILANVQLPFSHLSPDSSDLSSLDEEVVQKELEKLLRKRRRTKKSLSSPKPQPEVHNNTTSFGHHVPDEIPGSY